MSEVLQPAIELAEKGFPLTKRGAKFFHSNFEPGERLSADVVPLKADLTSTTSPGWDKLRELGRTGIPTLAVFSPGQSQPWIASAYTSDQVVEAIAAARAGGGS